MTFEILDLTFVSILPDLFIIAMVTFELFHIKALYKYVLLLLAGIKYKLNYLPFSRRKVMVENIFLKDVLHTK